MEISPRPAPLSSVQARAGKTIVLALSERCLYSPIFSQVRYAVLGPDQHRLLLAPGIEGLKPVLPPEATLLDSAERDLGRHLQVEVDPDDPGFEPCGSLPGGDCIARPD